MLHNVHAANFFLAKVSSSFYRRDEIHYSPHHRKYASRYQVHNPIKKAGADKADKHTMSCQVVIIKKILPTQT